MADLLITDSTGTEILTELARYNTALEPVIDLLGLGEPPPEILPLTISASVNELFGTSEMTQNFIMSAVNNSGDVTYSSDNNGVTFSESTGTIDYENKQIQLGYNLVTITGTDSDGNRAQTEISIVKNS